MSHSGIIHHRVNHGGVGLHAASLGEGPALLLIHGFPQHCRMWYNVMPSLAATGRRVVALDQRGCGGSDIPSDGYDKASLARDALAVMDALGIESAAVAGYDHGGGTALALAYIAPERVERLAVLEYAPPGFGYEVALTAAPGNVNWQLSFFTNPDIALQFLIGKERELLAWYFWHWSHNPDAVGQEDFEAYVRQLQKPGALRGGMQHFASVFEDTDLFRTWASEGKLSMPTLGVGGAAGSAAYPGMALSALASDVRSAVIEEAGHWLVEEQPERVVGEFLSFLK